MRIYTPMELEELDTLSEGQDADLKVDDGDFRVWLNRVTEEVEYEVSIDGRWFDATDTGRDTLEVTIWVR